MIDLGTVITRTSSEAASAPWAGKAIFKLQRHQIPFATVSRDARTTKHEVSSNLEKHLGLTIGPKPIITPEMPFIGTFVTIKTFLLLVTGVGQPALQPYTTGSGMS